MWYAPSPSLLRSTVDSLCYCYYHYFYYPYPHVYIHKDSQALSGTLAKYEEYMRANDLERKEKLSPLGGGGEGGGASGRGEREERFGGSRKIATTTTTTPLTLSSHHADTQMFRGNEGVLQVDTTLDEPLIGLFEYVLECMS